MQFKKTRTMNMVGAVLWALMGLALLVQKWSQQPAGMLLTIVLIYAVIVGVPAATAEALAEKPPRWLVRTALFGNWALIGVWVLNVTAAVTFHLPLVLALLGVVALVIPEAINIRALKRTLAATKEAQGLAWPELRG